MVKGLSRRVIVVDSPDPHIFEQAIFIVRNDAAVGSGGVTSPWLAALLGGAVIGAVWLLAMLL